MKRFEDSEASGGGKRGRTARRARFALGLTALFVAGLLTATGAFGQVLSDPGTTTETTVSTAVDTTTAPSTDTTTASSTNATTTDTTATTPAGSEYATTTTTTAPAPTPPPASPSPFTPSISSDKGDYAPGSTVTLTGSGWAPGESVHLFVNDTIG